MGDRVFGVLLLLGTSGHTVGTVLWTPFLSGIFVWSLGASLAGYLLGALHIIRAARPTDRTVALIAGLGTACWTVLSLGFGASIHNLLDPRVVGQVVIALTLVGFSIRTLVHTTAGSSADA
jgi:uncharacterized membrane protein YczE